MTAATLSFNDLHMIPEEDEEVKAPITTRGSSITARTLSVKNKTGPSAWYAKIDVKTDAKSEGQTKTRPAFRWEDVDLSFPQLQDDIMDFEIVDDPDLGPDHYPFKAALDPFAGVSDVFSELHRVDHGNRPPPALSPYQPGEGLLPLLSPLSLPLNHKLE